VDSLPDWAVSAIAIAVGFSPGLAILSGRPIARPVAKSIIKGGLIAYRQAEQLYSGAVEGIGDMVAEAQQEIGATTSAQSLGDRSTHAPLDDGQASDFPRRRSPLVDGYNHEFPSWRCRANSRLRSTAGVTAARASRS
jgi:Protein of unknown function (DUF5132)